MEVNMSDVDSRMLGKEEDGSEPTQNQSRDQRNPVAFYEEPIGSSKGRSALKKAIIVVLTCVVLYGSYAILADRVLSLAAARRAILFGEHSPSGCSTPTSTVPQYFQTSPELWAGPTSTGMAPFLAQTNPISFAATETFAPNNPLETGMPIIGQYHNDSIFHLMAHLSPYFSNPSGFGVAEYPLPPGAQISQVQMLSRHGSRYPTLGSNVQNLGRKLAEHPEFKSSDALAFLNDWKYELGYEILVPRGRQELFESGINHYYRYAQLYNPNSKIIVRTTTQDRMLKSAEYFMSGFFGLEWTNNATIEVIIESQGFNNSLAGYNNCKNADSERNLGGVKATKAWVGVYLQNATRRFQSMLEGLDWTIDDTYAAQTMCPYETVAYGYSSWCNLFTYEEWVGFEYSNDLYFAGSNAFQSPTGRAVGIGYVQEVVARLENHTLGYSGSQINTTLDDNIETFPLNQSLYFDFSHDTNIMSILTAFGFTQFNQFLPSTEHPGPHNLTVSHLEPFGCRLDIEIIRTPQPLRADRTYEAGGEATYIHFILNQRTLPLGLSFPECGSDRLDGWCALDTFLDLQKSSTALANYDFACNGDYPTLPYGSITNGAPVA